MCHRHMETTLRSLQVRSRMRGMKETCVIFEKFTNNYLTNMDAKQIFLFEKLLNETDHDILDWVLGSSCPPIEYKSIIHKIRRFMCN